MPVPLNGPRRDGTHKLSHECLYQQQHRTGATLSYLSYSQPSRLTWFAHHFVFWLVPVAGPAALVLHSGQLQSRHPLLLPLTGIPEFVALFEEKEKICKGTWACAFFPAALSLFALNISCTGENTAENREGHRKIAKQIYHESGKLCRAANI